MSGETFKPDFIWNGEEWIKGDLSSPNFPDRIEAAVVAEREACAKIVDQFSAEVAGQPKLMGFVDMIAREIRARKSD